MILVEYIFLGMEFKNMKLNKQCITMFYCCHKQLVLDVPPKLKTTSYVCYTELSFLLKYILWLQTHVDANLVIKNLTNH